MSDKGTSSNINKDELICQLKAHIFELEQHEQDYDELNKKYRKVQNENIILNEAKMRLEYELQHREDNTSQILSTIQNENDNYKVTISEKNSKNKSLYLENEEYKTTINLLQKEILQLNKKITDMSSQIDKLNEDKRGMEQLINTLSDMKNAQKNQIGKLIDDNTKLAQAVQKNERDIKRYEEEKRKLIAENDKMLFEMKNIQGRINAKEDSMIYLQNHIDQLKNDNLSLEGKIKDLDMNNQVLQNENSKLEGRVKKYAKLCAEEEKKNEQLNFIIDDNKKEIQKMSKNISEMDIAYKQIVEVRNVLDISNDNYKNHIIMLTKQNAILVNEIENIIESDSEMLNVLHRKEYLESLLQHTKIEIEASLNSFKCLVT